MLLFFPLLLVAQTAGGSGLSWDDFVNEYVENGEWEESDPPSGAQLDYLEELAARPLQINRASREDFLTLPFVTEEQVDSLLSYRRAKRGFGALGELMLVKGWDYSSRRYLSLFVRCDSLYLSPKEKTPRRKGLWGKLTSVPTGKHEVETRLDVPLYRREGYRTPAAPTHTNYYTGNSLHHILRYRYAVRREVACGLTMEKDAGEPVGCRGFYPYDYLSGYVVLRPYGKSWALALGDYELWGGRGLLFGRAFYAGREQLVQPLRQTATTFRAHTSADESRFFRGAAFSRTFRRMDVLVFASYRLLDARLTADGDTARSLLQTGLHRTLSERERRRNLGCLTAGGHIGYRFRAVRLALSGYASRFHLPLWPETRWYNLGYFRGRTAGGAAFSYHFQKGAWTLQGETACDHGLYVATEHAVGFRPSSRLMCNLQVRSFSPRYVSLYGHALQQGSRVANEQGVMGAVRFFPRQEVELTAYIDLFRFPRPTYTAKLPCAKGMEWQVQGKWSPTSRRSFLFRYRMRVRQQTVSGYDLLEYRQLHRLRFSSTFTGGKFSLTPQFDASLALRQTGGRSFGWMPSLRAAWKPGGHFSLKAFFSVFFTDSYDSRLYAYEPQLYRAASFSSFSYHGLRMLVLAGYAPTRRLTLSLRVSSTRYFNRNQIASGTELICSPWKNDLSLQLRWRTR